MTSFETACANAISLCNQLAEIAPRLRPSVCAARLASVAQTRTDIDAAAKLHGVRIQIANPEGDVAEYEIVDMTDVIEYHAYQVASLIAYANEAVAA